MPPKKKLTKKQRLDMMLTPCKTREELKRWIKYHLGLDLPDVTVSRYSDTNPFDIVWELYNITVLNNNPKNIDEILCVAGRGTGKTLGMAIFELLVIFHDQRDAVHVGAIMAQAERCYTYVKGFLYNKRLKNLVMPPRTPEDDRILEKSNMSKSVFNIKDQKITLEVIPCTMKATNGPHVPLVVIDEIDTVSGEGVKAFREITGMIDTKGGKRALRVGISTRKSRYGLMNKQIENAIEEQREIRRWTAFEFYDRCTDERSGINPIDLYVVQEDMEVINTETYNKKTLQKQKEYIKYVLPGENCEKCALASICLGDAKKQTGTSFMLKPLDELVKKVKSEGTDWALAQLMNLKPSIEGIIFREFDERVHVVSWNDMWFKLTGSEFPGECTHDLFVKKCHEMRLPCYGGVDWGWSSPSTVVYFFVDKRDNIYIVRTDGMTYYSQPAWIHYFKTKYQNKYRCQLYFADTADQGAIEEMRKAGLPVAREVDKAINTGVQLIKKFLKTPGSQEPKILMTRDTSPHIIEEFSLYHFKTDAAGLITETPEDKNNHWLDAFRYPLSMLFGKVAIVDIENVSDDSSIIRDQKGHFYRAPTAAEFATAEGSPFNPDVDTSNLGKIGTKSELEDDDEDGIGGEGGFLWSW